MYYNSDGKKIKCVWLYEYNIVGYLKTVQHIYEHECLPKILHLRHNMLATADATNSCFKYLSSADKSVYIIHQ